MISICIPSLNALPYLKLFVSSLKKNTRIPTELIVVDNGSDDGTSEWLQENKIYHFRNETNKGFCAVNDAIKASKYPYCFIANADMFLLPRMGHVNRSSNTEL